jgi:hypothetical protein
VEQAALEAPARERPATRRSKVDLPQPLGPKERRCTPLTVARRGASRQGISGRRGAVTGLSCPILRIGDLRFRKRPALPPPWSESSGAGQTHQVFFLAEPNFLTPHYREFSRISAHRLALRHHAVVKERSALQTMNEARI